MNRNQDNLNRAALRGRDSLVALSQGTVVMRNLHVRKLQEIAWDLEAIQAAIRGEINDRADSNDRNRMDLG